MHLAALVLAAWACSEAEAPNVLVTDSAGVRITLSVDTARTFALVDSLPLLSLGGVDASGPTLFANIQGVHLDRLGRVWVADRQSAEVRLFDGRSFRAEGRSKKEAEQAAAALAVADASSGEAAGKTAGQ